MTRAAILAGSGVAAGVDNARVCVKSKQIEALVDASAELDRQIAALKTELDVKKQTLVGLAAEILRRELGPPGNIVGASQTFAGASGQAWATVQFPHPKLVSGFYLLADDKGRPIAWRTKDDVAIQIGPLRDLAGLAFEHLFAQSWKPAKAFRELALSHLGIQKAGKLVSMCEEPSSPRVGFDTKPPKDKPRPPVVLSV